MSLPRRVAASVVETLKTKGHILVVKGGSEALVRELDAMMAEQLTKVSAGVAPRTVVGEVTSTFGDEAIDEAIEEMVGTLAERLMDSDHVEDVFAEDNVIRRDIFRAVRDSLLQGAGVEAEVEEEEDAAGPISVRLDTLGYVASTVAKRADTESLKDALERAALAFEGQLENYDNGAREATFAMPAGDPDVRLELEEAVAEELTDLVDMGIVDLPAAERRLPLPRPLPPAERAALKPRLDAALAQAVQRLGFAASWDFLGSNLVATFTPLSEKDTQIVEERAEVFARSAAEILATVPPAPVEDVAGPSSRRGTVADAAPPPASNAVKRAGGPTGAPAAEAPVSKRAAAVEAPPSSDVPARSSRSPRAGSDGPVSRRGTALDAAASKRDAEALLSRRAAALEAPVSKRDAEARRPNAPPRRRPRSATPRPRRPNAPPRRRPRSATPLLRRAERASPRPMRRLPRRGRRRVPRRPPPRAPRRPRRRWPRRRPRPPRRRRRAVPRRAERAAELRVVGL
ncbi:MAG: hypothetical protein WKG00_15255 [Polyangiaceae bacterium]